ncbi:radical SAM protein [Actinomadura rubrisoli]|uniref:Radical SAM protein n=1 Tax=Actinomadura rubrisoli TaxID=2530368 RepID=A0A4R5AV78_9ACTN|nr:radical SAM protein [Actinomadura rubrisoli]TDD75064.1 radical SAM protein [Actinomadura rubrisoli]
MPQPSAAPAHPSGGVPKTRPLSRSTSHRHSGYTPPAGSLPTLVFDPEAQCFKAPGGERTDALVDQMDRPLSLTFQLTRDCNFSCAYCSEPPGVATRSYEEVLAMLDKLSGMRRIILSGGEPMRYRHFWKVLTYCQSRFEQVVLSTNASMITRDGAARLRDLVDYVDITVDGPRAQHDRIRGTYDMVIRGLRRVAEEDIPLSVICVYLGRNKRKIHYIAQTGDVFGAKKIKILTTIPKGYSRNLFENFTTGEELDELEAFLKVEREECGWLPRITIADWMRIGAGHAILIEPDGRAVASPVWQETDCIVPFGNLHEQTAAQLWAAYPYKREHLDKYLERTMVVVE